MKKLSVITNGINNREIFLNNIFTEIGTEITADVKDNEILFYDIDNIKENLYNVLAKNIVNEFEKKLLVKIINKNCDYFSKADKYEIWKKSMRKLLNDEVENNFEYADRIRNIEVKLEDFLKNSNTLSIEGFVNFRLKEFEDELEEIVEDCVQEYLLELEYAEFINMLKYYLSMQYSKYLTVEVVYGDKVYVFGDGKNITSECINNFNDGLYDITSKDDFVLNSLITLAPKRVILKQKKLINDEFKKTLLGIFGDKIKITTE